MQSTRPERILSMDIRILILGVGCCLSIMPMSALSDQIDANLSERIGMGDIEYGKELSNAERCQECHGEDGNGNGTDLHTPKHAGQYADYLVKQLKDFQTGARQHVTMNIMAEDLIELDMTDIAAYFASQKIMRGTSENEKTEGKRLFLTGDSSRGLQACSECHGAGGKGRFVDGIAYPVIGGQRKAYLYRQLVNWKSGDRTNSPDGIMNKIARLLTEREIESLSDYISGLSD